MSDTAAISQWASMRLAVGAAMFVAYFMYYAAYHFANFRQSERPKLYVQISSFGSKMYLFGAGCLLSINYSQASIYQTIFTYLSMVAVISVILLTIFDTISEKLRICSHILFYFFLVMWYMGIVVDYFKSQNWKWVYDLYRVLFH